MSIIQPPKIFLDTNHLICIARHRKGIALPQNVKDSYSFIDRCIREWHFGLIFHPGSPLEWVDGNATLESALEIAAVVDSARLQYEIEVDHFVYLYEVLAEIHRIDASIRLPEFEIFFHRNIEKEVVRPLGVLANQVPGYFEEHMLPAGDDALLEAVPTATAAEFTESAFNFKHRRQESYSERVNGHIDAYLHDVKAYEQYKKFDQWMDVIGWMEIRNG